MSRESTETHVSTNDELSDAVLARLKIAVPGYKLLKEISRGGQAIVFKASDVAGKSVAVKLLIGGQLADDAARERLKREARVLAALKHKHIVSFIDFGQTDDGHDYLVMDYIEGRRLDAFFPKMGQTPRSTSNPLSVLELFVSICEAVNAAHLCGITHRDLSPSNIMIDQDGNPIILDFGLARTAFDHLFSPDVQGPTITGQFIGKLAYASPEQASGMNKQIDIRTDVYALGVILYQLVTDGRFPYGVVGCMAEVLNNIMSAKPTPPTQVHRSSNNNMEDGGEQCQAVDACLTDAVIESIILKALEKRPDDRYQSAGALAKDIREYLSSIPRLDHKTAVASGLDGGAVSTFVVGFASFLIPIFLMTLWLVLAWHFRGWPFSAPK